jgi:alpha-tubulin suppressor-like RCC1 family protein
MRPARSSLLSLLALALGSCAPALSVGAPCALSSECPDPLVCLLGRCRSECANNRDCDGDGDLCLLDAATGARACRTPAELTCAAGGSECGSGLVCLAGRCAAPCEDTSDCIGTVCATLPMVGGVCVEPTGEACADGSECAFGVCSEGSCDPVREVVAGGAATCVLLESGRLACAGLNGTRVISPENVLFIPAFTRVVDVAGSQPPFESVAVGLEHACALSSGRVRCWGSGRMGQNGAGSMALPFPGTISALSEVLELDAAGDSSCVRTESDVLCFGRDVFGQLGDSAMHGGGAEPFTSSPVRVELPTEFVPRRLDIGGFHGCATGTGGGLFCWGADDYGQIHGETTASTCSYDGTDYRCFPTPVMVPGFGPAAIVAVELALGQSHTCVLDERHAVHCFGRNDRGQIGNGSSGGAVSTPFRVFSGEVEEIEAGLSHTCARLTDGRVSCWGNNQYGALGTGGGAMGTSPADADLPEAVTKLSCGFEHCCALGVSGALFCWGSTRGGRLGDDPDAPEDRAPAYIPVRVRVGS